MLALVLAAALSSAGLQQWINDQPDVRAYENLRVRQHPPAEDAFRRSPSLSKEVACQGSRRAIAAAIALFKTADASRLTLTEPNLLAENAYHPVVQLDDKAKMALETLARRYQLEASLYKPACIG